VNIQKAGIAGKGVKVTCFWKRGELVLSLVNGW
jgi:hypothetical protein